MTIRFFRFSIYFVIDLNNFLNFSPTFSKMANCGEKSSPSQPTVAQVPKGSPSEWTIEEVIQFITATYPVLAVHADMFRKHVRN